MPQVPPDQLQHVSDRATADIATVVLGVALALVLAFGLREWRRTGSPVLVLCLLGGAVAMLIEPLWDQMGRLYIYEHGVGSGYVSIAGRTLPYWLLAPYSIFVGGTAYMVYRVASGGCARAWFYGALGATVALNLLFEIPLTHAHLYVYFGDQAFAPSDFPASWAFMNLGGVLSGLALAKAPRLFRGAGVLLIPPLVTACFAAWEMGIGWPVYVANASDAGLAWTYVGAVAAIGSSILAVRALARVAFNDTGPHRPSHQVPQRAAGDPSRPADRDAGGLIVSDGHNGLLAVPAHVRTSQLTQR
jgi:hypothetical protein